MGFSRTSHIISSYSPSLTGKISFVSRGKGVDNFLHLSRPLDILRVLVVSKKNLVWLKVQEGERTSSCMAGMKNSSQGFTEDILVRGSPVLFKWYFK